MAEVAAAPLRQNSRGLDPGKQEPERLAGSPAGLRRKLPLPNPELQSQALQSPESQSPESPPVRGNCSPPAELQNSGPRR
ncbi:hypothetical protein GCM10011586_14230 [Silvibacterium dinghuense]|nr:hypothetical protein GCM10011586_14230 [Silvibacterium dinghuense]